MNIKKKKKSMPLTEDELKLLKEHISKFDTRVAAALSLGVDRNVMDRAELAGRASEDSVRKIRHFFKSQEVKTA